MRHAGAPGGTAWTQPDLMDCLQLFVAVSLWWTLRLSPSLSNDMGAGIPEPPVATQLHITSCGLPWIYRAHHFPAQTNLRIRHVGASMLTKPTESTCRQFNPPQRLLLYNRATRDQEQRSPSTDRGWCIAGENTTRKLPIHQLSFQLHSNACISQFDTFQTNLF